MQWRKLGFLAGCSPGTPFALFPILFLPPNFWSYDCLGSWECFGTYLPKWQTVEKTHYCKKGEIFTHVQL